MLKASEAMEAITEGLREHGGRFILSFDPDSDTWVCGIEWGKEDEDSDMVGAAAYGTSEHGPAAVAVEQALSETGWLDA